MSLRPPAVSDHALLRYLERVRGLDLDAVRAEIVGIVHQAAAVGATRVSVNGFTYMLEGRRVVTVTPGGSPSAAVVKGLRANGSNKRVRR